MNRHPPGAREYARRILQHEGNGCPDGAAVADALERAWGKLSSRLEPLLGKGADALITRAVHLARREFPFLGLVRPAISASVEFLGVRESLSGRSGAEAEAAGVAVLESLVGLLVGLLGENLGLAPVRAIWPDVVPGAAETPSNEWEE